VPYLISLLKKIQLLLIHDGYSSVAVLEDLNYIKNQWLEMKAMD
jgi:hypothetical protein